MSTNPAPSAAAFDSARDDTLLLLNRATVVMHTIRAVAHELNNVLQMISGSAELLELDPSVPASMRPKLKTIARHTGRGRDLVAAVSDLARALPPVEHTVDARRAIARVQQLRKFEHSRAAIDFTVLIMGGEPLVVRAEAAHLQLMLLNLVINAEQAVAQTSPKAITLTVTADGETCEMIVRDSGQEPLGEAGCFSPFVTTRSLLVAPGLGLAATRLLASRYGGHVIVRQATPGTEAVLTLPMGR